MQGHSAGLAGRIFNSAGYRSRREFLRCLRGGHHEGHHRTLQTADTSDVPQLHRVPDVADFLPDSGKVPQRHGDGYNQLLGNMYLPQSHNQVPQREAFQHQRSGHQARKHPAGIGGKDGKAGGDNHRRCRQDHLLKEQQSTISYGPFGRHRKPSMDNHQRQQQADQRQFYPQSMIAERDDIGGDQYPQPRSRVKN